MRRRVFDGWFVLIARRTRTDIGELYFFFIYDFKRRSLTRTLPFGLGRVSAGEFDICFSSKKRSKFEFTSARL